MQVLTPTGYVDINDLNVGDEVIAYDINDGHLFTNILEAKTKWTYDMLPAVPPVYELDAEGNIVYDEDGNPVILEPGKTSEQVFQETYGDWKFYLINNTWVLYCNQSVWANMNVTHASQLQLGDIVYDDQNQDVVITSIEEVTAPDWWRLQVSGDHSYIADNLTLHNASRYWVGGGSSSNWNATGNTNWGSTSGGPNNASIPVSTDDVTFDAGGPTSNTNSTISSTAGILSLNITSAYTSTMTHDALLVIAGNWTFTGGYTVAGISGVTINGTSTITSNGTTWPNSLSFATGSSTKTLVGNLTVGGVLSIEDYLITVNKTTTETLTCVQGLSVNQYLRGSADIYITGGSWGGNNPVENNLFLNGTITVGGSVNKTGGTLTYVGGTITTTGSTLNLSGGPTLNTNGITWANINVNTGSLTLSSNLSCSGLFNIAANTTINKTTNEILTIGGGLTLGGWQLNGNLDIYLTGGTWSGSAILLGNLYINGNVTVSGTVTKYGGLLKYQSGTVTTTGSTLTIQNSPTLDTNGITWNNFTSSSSNTVSLLSNFVCSGLFTVSGTTIINTSVSSTLTSGGGLTINAALSGTAKIILSGGTWSSNGSSIVNNLDINGNVIISGSVAYSGTAVTNSTLTYISGTVTTTGSTLSMSGTNVLNTNGITWNNITFTANGTTTTLTSNLSCSGLLSSPAGRTINSTTSETITIGGGLSISGSIIGTAKLILTGGTWSGGGNLQNSLDIQGNVTISGTVAKSGGTITYLSGTVTTTSSTLNITGANGGCTFNTNGITWNNVTFITNSGTHALTSNFACSGLVSVNIATVINTSVGATFTSGGGLTMSNTVSGTAKIILTGGTWSANNALSNNLDINGNVTISGPVLYSGTSITYLSGTITTTGSTITFSSNTTITSGSIVWNNVTLTTVSSIKTLVGDFNVNGLVSVASNNIVINKTTNEVANFSGGLSMGGPMSGTADIYLKGGTWSNSGTLSSNLYFQGNVTISGSVTYQTGTMTYVSGTVTTTGSTLQISDSCTLNTGLLSWNNLKTTKLTGSITITLTSNLIVNGQLWNAQAGAYTCTINKTASETVTVNGGIALSSASLSGTATIYFNGGTWTTNGSNAANIFSNVIINGNVTVSGTVYFGGTLTYLSGSVSALGSTLLLSNCTLDTNGILWGAVQSQGATVTLNSNFNIGGLLTTLNNGPATFNSSNGSKLVCFGGLTMFKNIAGTAEIYFKSGVYSVGDSITNNLYLDGNCVFTGNLIKSGGNLTYVSGNIDMKQVSLSITSSSSVYKFNKVPLRSVVVTAGMTVFMDSFFTGVPSRACTVSSTGANYAISFADGFEKIARYVKVTGATILNNQQLIIITNPRFNTNRATNSLGIRYTNQSPNGAPKNSPSIADTMTVPALGLVNDPCFQYA